VPVITESYYIQMPKSTSYELSARFIIQKETNPNACIDLYIASYTDVL